MSDPVGSSAIGSIMAAGLIRAHQQNALKLGRMDAVEQDAARGKQVLARGIAQADGEIERSRATRRWTPLMSTMAGWATGHADFLAVGSEIIKMKLLESQWQLDHPARMLEASESISTPKGQALMLKNQDEAAAWARDRMAKS